LQTQILLWSLGFYALAVLVAGAACFAAGRTLNACKEGEPQEVRPSAVQCLSWIVLAAIPSALVIAVTAYISTDLAAAPWMLPLALYLSTFIAVFRERQWIERKTVQRLVPYDVAPLAFSAMGADTALWLVMIAHIRPDCARADADAQLGKTG
jgi:hypothetical protein